MSTCVMSRNRVRRSTTIVSATTASEDTSASRAAQNATFSLPTELIYMILAISTGDYMSDMILFSRKILKWDAIMTFLHTSRSFRECTIELLYHLWGGTFIRKRTIVIENYKPTLYIFRHLSQQAHNAPRSFTSQYPQPRLLSARVVRHPITPLARIWSALIRNSATTEVLLEFAREDWTCGDFEEAYTEEDVRIIKDSYAEIPAGIRPLLLGNVMHQIMTQAAFWTKLKELKAAACSMSRILAVQLEHKEPIEIPVELPKIPEDSVAQTSRERHANYADTFSLDGEDIPPLYPNHATVVGLRKMLLLLSYVKYKYKNADLHQIMTNHIGCMLTDSERVQYLWNFK